MSTREFSNYWEPDIPRKLIRLRYFSLLKRTWLRLFVRFTVNELYSWAMGEWSSLDMMIHEIPIRSDNLHQSKTLKLPHKYQLSNGWSIPAQDLHLLHSGPLLNEQGNNILVPAYGPLVARLLWLRDHAWWLGLLLAIIGIVIGVMAL